MTQHAKKIGRNALWATLGLLLPTVIMLVTIPVFLGFLGARMFGLWTIVNATLGMLGILNLGLGDAATKFIAEYSEQERSDLVNLVATVTLGLFAVLGALGAVLLMLLANWLAHDVFKLAPTERALAVDVFRIAAWGVPPSLAIPAVVGVLNGFQRYRESQLINIGRSSLVAVAGIATLAAGTGIVGLVTVAVVVYWCILLAGVTLLWVMLKLRPKSPWGHEKEARAVLAYGFFSMLNRIGMLAFASFDRVLIGSLVDLTAVTYYAVSQNVTSRLHMLVAGASQVLMPYFSAEHARTEVAPEVARERLLKSWRVSIVIAMALTAGLLAISPWLLKAWIGNAFHQNAFPIVLILTGCYAIGASLVVPYYYLLGRGYPAYVAAAQTICGGIFLGLIYLFGEALGITFVAACFSLFAVFCAIVARRAVALAGLSVRQLGQGLLKLLVAMSLAVLTGIAAGSGMERLWGNAWASVVSAAIGAGAALLVLQQAIRRGANPYGDAMGLILDRLPLLRRLRSR